MSSFLTNCGFLNTGAIIWNEFKLYIQQQMNQSDVSCCYSAFISEKEIVRAFRETGMDQNIDAQSNALGLSCENEGSVHCDFPLSKACFDRNTETLTNSQFTH